MVAFPILIGAIVPLLPARKMTLRREVIAPFCDFQRLKPVDRIVLAMGDAVQLIMKMETPAFAKQTVQKLKSELIGLHLKSDCVFFMPAQMENLVVHEIPRDLKTILEVDDWLVNTHPLLPAERLGVIAANEDFVAINMSHSCADGKYLCGIVDHIFDPIKSLQKPYPTPLETIFADEIKAAKHVDRMPVDKDTTRFLERGEKVGQELSLISRVNMKDFACYDKQTGKCRHLSEIMWLTYALSMGTLFNSMDNIGVQVCVDMRQFMDSSFKKKNLMNLCNLFSCVRVGAGKNWQNLSVGETCARIRKELVDKLKNDHVYGFLKMYGGSTELSTGGTILPTQWLGNSHLGAVKIRAPVQDVWFSEVIYNDLFRDMHQTLTYSIINETKGTNEHVTIMKYGSNGVTEKEAKTAMNAWIQGLRTFTWDMPIKEALKRMKQFQT